MGFFKKLGFLPNPVVREMKWKRLVLFQIKTPPLADAFNGLADASLTRRVAGAYPARLYT